MPKFKSMSRLEKTIYLIGLINVFMNVPIGSMMLGLLIPIGMLYLMLLPLNLLLWRGVVRRNREALLVQIIILVILVIDSLLLTLLIPIIGFYTTLNLDDLLRSKLGFPSGPLVAPWIILLPFGVNFGFIIIPIFFISDLYSTLYDVDWIKYESIIMGPLTLISSIICLAMIIKYYKTYYSFRFHIKGK